MSRLFCTTQLNLAVLWRGIF